jgi:hypothetical protein
MRSREFLKPLALSRAARLLENSVQDLQRDIISQVKQTQDQELLDRIYTVLNKSGLASRISTTIKSDTDARGAVHAITQIIIDTPGTYQEKYKFIEGYPNGYVDIKKMLSGARVNFDDLLGSNAFAHRVFLALKQSTFGSAKGPGEYALAVLSPHIRIHGKGDLDIAGRIIEVKASAGATASSGGGRLGEPGLLQSRDVQQILDKYIPGLNPAVSYPSGLGLGGLLKLSASLPLAKKRRLAQDLFGYIFPSGTDIGPLVAAFIQGHDLRDDYVKANYQAYKEHGGFEGIMIVNFALGELQYFADVDALSRHVYKGIGVYLISVPDTQSQRQILSQVTLAPYREPPVVIPDAPGGQRTTKTTQEFAEKIRHFASGFAKQQGLTDPAVISQIFHSTMQSLEKGMAHNNILIKLKKLYPKAKVTAEPADVAPVQPVPIPNTDQPT